MFDVLTWGPSEVSKFRRQQLEYWTGRAAELEAYEQEVQEGVHESVKEWLKGKRTELLKEMLVEARVPSPDYVVALLRRGAPPCGELPASGAFEPRHHGATKSLKQVLQAEKWSKAVLRSTVRPSGDAELDREVADRTDEEVLDGKAQGPFDEEEVDILLGKCWSPCRRVGKRQGGAIRSIDDFSLNLGTMDPQGRANIWRCPEPTECAR